ncbi:AbiH family protein [Peptoanaerobacter stomatis]
MNILVIGNGFDLAHGLPTKYGDFLDSVEAVKLFNNDYNKYIENLEGLKKELYKKVLPLENDNRLKDGYGGILYEYIKENFWIEHFFKRRNEIGENWIDFEKEIADVLEKLKYNEKKIDAVFWNILDDIIKYRIDSEFNKKQIETLCIVLKNLSKIFKLKNDEEGNIKNNWENLKKHLNRFSIFSNGLVLYHNYKESKRAIVSDELIIIDNLTEANYLKKSYEILIEVIIHTLEDDLIKLIRAFEVYLLRVVHQQKFKEISEDIISIPLLEKVISFNYTDTCLRILNYISENKDNFIKYNKYLNSYGYKIPTYKDILYIHGSAEEYKINSPLEIEENNDDMILGVYEKLKDEKNICDDFIFFKKYYQRILKNTDGNNELEEDYYNRVPKEDRKFTYERCLENIKGSYIYIFGHSLDVSDNDLLEKLIVKSRKTIIYYHNRETNKIQIINLIKMLGQEKLVEYRNSGKIIFMKQKENIEIENDDDKDN